MSKSAGSRQIIVELANYLRTVQSSAKLENLLKSLSSTEIHLALATPHFSPGSLRCNICLVCSGKITASKCLNTSRSDAASVKLIKDTKATNEICTRSAKLERLGLFAVHRKGYLQSKASAFKCHNKVLFISNQTLRLEKLNYRS